MKHLQRLALVAGLALFASGCQTWDIFQRVTAATVSSKTVVLGIQAFDGTQIIAASYLRLPICRPTDGPICREREATPVIKQAVAGGRRARNSLKAEIRRVCAADFDAGRECTQGIKAVTYNSLVDASETIKNVTAAYRAATKQ